MGGMTRAINHSSIDRASSVLKGPPFARTSLQIWPVSTPHDQDRGVYIANCKQAHPVLPLAASTERYTAVELERTYETRIMARDHADQVLPPSPVATLPSFGLFLYCQD
jgi:hypothetical protein